MFRHLLFLIFLLSIAACGHGSAGPDAGLKPDTARPDATQAASIKTVLNEAYPKAALALMDGAKTSLKLVHFFINKDSAGDLVVASLKAAANRGVKVQVVLEHSVDDNPGRVTELSAAGVSAKLDEKSIYTHAKLLVADDATALFGSSNFSWSSMNKNNEANLLVTDPTLVKFYADYADAIYSSPGSRPSLTPASTALGTAMDDGD